MNPTDERGLETKMSMGCSCNCAARRRILSSMTDFLVSLSKPPMTSRFWFR